MLHEEIETDVLGVEVAVGNGGVAGAQFAWVHFDLDLPLVGVAGDSHEESWHWEPLLHDVFGILTGRFEEQFEVLVVWIVVVAGLLPLNDSWALPNADVEEGVE